MKTTNTFKSKDGTWFFTSMEKLDIPYRFPDGQTGCRSGVASYRATDNHHAVIFYDTPKGQRDYLLLPVDMPINRGSKKIK